MSVTLTNFKFIRDLTTYIYKMTNQYVEKKKHAVGAVGGDFWSQLSCCMLPPGKQDACNFITNRWDIGRNQLARWKIMRK